MNNRPIFIGGLMKSGTTLLRTMMSNHRNIFSGLETHWFEKVFVKDDDIEYINKMAVYFDLSIETVKEIIKISNSNNYPFLKVFFDFLTKENNKKRWVEKTPQNIKFIEKIRSNFIDFTFIYVQRDLRDVYASWKNSKKYNLNYFIDEVKETEERFSSQKKLIESNLYNIKYELLVRNPKIEISKLLDFINEEIDSNCFVNNSLSSKVEFDKINKLYNKKSVTLKSLQEDINLDKVGYYKKILTENEINLIELELGELLNNMGYE